MTVNSIEFPYDDIKRLLKIMSNGSWGEMHGKKSSRWKPDKSPSSKWSKEEPGRRLPHHQDWTTENWTKVSFPEDSNFQPFPTPAHPVVRQRPGEACKPKSHSHCDMWWGMWWPSERLESGTFGFVKDAWIIHIQSHPWRNLLPSALVMFPNSKDWFFPIMAIPISRPEPH